MDLQPLSSRAAEAARKRYLKHEPGYRVCSICDRQLKQKHFSGRNSQCNSCIAGKIAICGNPACKKGSQKVENFQIYSVPADKYYCTQGCHDKANGLNRSRLNEWGQDE